LKFFILKEDRRCAGLRSFIVSSRSARYSLLPEYGRIYRHNHGFEPLLAAYQSGKKYVLRQFVRRPLRELPFLADMPDGRQFSDITNRYGFGGPVCSATDASIARDRYTHFFAEFAAML